MIVKKHDERGMVSITVTVILMLVISLTVLSFAQIIRREQREALDNQLSSQAYYAAESGINATRTFIKKNPLLLVGGLPAKNDCASTGVYNSLPTEVAGTDTSVSCLLINSTPGSLRYDLSTNSGLKVVPLKPAGGPLNILDRLTLTWQMVGTAGNVTSCQTANLPKASAWNCPYGMIRIDLVPVSTGNLSRETLMANTYSAFLTPSTGGSNSQYQSGININGGFAQQAIRPAATCNADKCTITITGLSAKPGDYYARISTLYKDASLTITGKTSTLADVRFKDAQLLVDSTGKSLDVLKRVQVRLPLSTPGLHADYGITTNQTFCKTIDAFPGDPLNNGCI